MDARTAFITLVVLGGAILVATTAHAAISTVIERFAIRRNSPLTLAYLNSMNRPMRFVLLLTALAIAVPLTPVADYAKPWLQHTFVLAAIAAAGWTIAGLVSFLARWIEAKYRIDVADNLAARRVRTQSQLLVRIFIAAIIIVTIGLMLMTFPEVRQVGTSLLASAGLAGVIAGMAARSTFASVIAGLQVALTQPIRIDDAVIVEGEWGWIEEITATYVVVRLWDWRRMILPLTYFIEKPFQNWTRITADLIGTAMFYVDYTLPVEEMRRELRRVLGETKLWDGKVWSLQVTDLTERTMQVRCIMSSTDASNTFDLRCYVRERLIAFLQENYPQCLPVARENNRIDPLALPQIPEDSKRA